MDALGKFGEHAKHEQILYYTGNPISMERPNLSHGAMNRLSRGRRSRQKVYVRGGNH